MKILIGWIHSYNPNASCVGHTVTLKDLHPCNPSCTLTGAGIRHYFDLLVTTPMLEIDVATQLPFSRLLHAALELYAAFAQRN